MKATALEFRFRFLIHAVLYGLGFVVPWNKWLHLDTVRTWQWLASWPSRAGWLGFSASTVAVLVVGVLFALVAALLRTWGAAYLGSGVVQDAAMHGDRLVAAGPYRYMRNPLYLGTFLHTFALALLTMPSGALFMLVTIGVLELRLIGAEEAFLTEKLGEPYRAYCAVVPRIIPSLRPRLASSAVKPVWGVAVLGEIYMWGVAFSFAALGWMYNSILILQGVMVSLGLSLVMRALLPRQGAVQVGR
ncbi:methyltransferase family protein [Edaphobacter modestus]|uniref:Phospholipid methyltransferase n=1 Tax=Edaphobacter modestus TaxID=388466 RepID=A0A4V2G4Q8_9BACT|nr:isoprenylcysteine carboxylmethyltransferase family protein [Edaphobacter modestus]RZU41716.1 phospholipid methyltransferase [Edaphobacter modestus]